MQMVKPYVQSKAEAARTSSWRRRPMHHWRGQRISTNDLAHRLGLDAAARRDAICRLMEDNRVPNTERGHRQAYAKIWTDRVRRRLGEPPRPGTVVRWRRKHLAARAAGIIAAREPVAVHSNQPGHVGQASGGTLS